MEILILLGILGAAAVFTSGSDSDTEEETITPEALHIDAGPETVPPVPPVPPVAPVTPVEPVAPVEPGPEALNQSTNGDDVIILPQNASTSEIRGGEGNDLLQGNDRDNTLRGDGGQDTLIGRGGNDILLDTEDREGFPLNTSVMNGGPGDDQLAFDNGSTVTGGTGSDQFFSI